MMRIRVGVVIGALLLGVAAPAVAQPAPGEPVAAMSSGKELFEKYCKLCHGLDRTLASTRDAPAWGGLIKRMVAYGAPLNVDQRALVVRYLATRSSFAGKCGGCHELTRVVSDTARKRDWSAIAKRMAVHVREVEKQGKTPAGVAFSLEELGDIAALLEVVIP